MHRSARHRLEEAAALTARERLLINAHKGGTGSMPEYPERIGALLDATAALASLGVPHALVGGVAVGIHSGVPRATLDIDLAVLSTSDRGRVIAAMEQAGFQSTGQFPHSDNFRHKSGEPVQLAYDVQFDPMIARAERFEVAATWIPLVTKSDLIAMKERAAIDPARRRSKALQDQADVALLRGDVPDPDEGW